MNQLAMWSIEAVGPDDNPGAMAPKAVGHSDVGLERYLEQWIVDDVALIGEGLSLVGQQVSLYDGKLDLLAIDAHDRWVVIEIKAGEVTSAALCQALGYAASLARFDAKELSGKLKPELAGSGDAQAVARKIETILDNEDGPREIALMVVGIGVHPSLERLKDFLERFQIPISIVSFEVFKPATGPKLLVRKVIEELVDPAPPKRKYTVAAIRQMAADAGVAESFDAFVDMVEAAGLAVQPQKLSIRIAPPADRVRCLMYAQPFIDRMGNGVLRLCVYEEPLLEFYPTLDKGKVRTIDGQDYLTGQAMTRRLEEIRRFLTDQAQHFQPAADEGLGR